jgi:hypothetical protein
VYAYHSIPGCLCPGGGGEGRDDGADEDGRGGQVTMMALYGHTIHEIHTRDASFHRG